MSFGAREFKHPARESKREEEEEWLRRHALAQASKKRLAEEEGLDYPEVVRRAGAFYRAGDLPSAEEVGDHL